MYKLIILKEAEADIDALKHSGQKKTLKKLQSLLLELIEHPRTGSGKVEQLKGDKQGFWSRQLNKKDRLIYTIEDSIVTVFVVSALGHYNDK
jgi:toxin YoeB